MISSRTFRAFNFNIISCRFIYIVQLFEYNSAPFTIFEVFMDHFFFLLTGFHGLHVIFVRFLILVCFIRFLTRTSYTYSPCGLELAAWYWHFVDAVWFVLYLLII